MNLELEPWMRGYLAHLDPVRASVLYSLQQVREDVVRWTEGLHPQQLWYTEGEIASPGFQLRHLAGSTDRLITYALGKSLTEAQLAALGNEKAPGPTLPELLDALETSLQKAEAAVRNTDPSNLADARELGRKRIPTTLGGLLLHTAEHAQRHIGELIVSIKFVRLRRTPSAE